MVRSNPAACRPSSNARHIDRGLRAFAAAAVACVLLTGQTVRAEQEEPVLRVCADPDNMPLSNKNGEGYENRIAEELARDMGRRVEYTYFPQRMGFVRHTLKLKDEQTQKFKCDVIIGVPKGYELTATTQPYMRSTYALVFPARDEFADLKTAQDLVKLPPAKLHSLKIGVFGFSPGADWLLRNELIDQAVMYSPQSGDPSVNPAVVVERDLAAGNIDMAILWGPMAGFLARQHAAAPQWRAVPFTQDSDIKFDYEIAMGVRFGEKQWQGALDDWIARHRPKVEEILTSYRVPLLDASGKAIAQ